MAKCDFIGLEAAPIENQLDTWHAHIDCAYCAYDKRVKVARDWSPINRLRNGISLSCIISIWCRPDKLLLKAYRSLFSARYSITSQLTTRCLPHTNDAACSYYHANVLSASLRSSPVRLSVCPARELQLENKKGAESQNWCERSPGQDNRRVPIFSSKGQGKVKGQGLDSYLAYTLLTCGVTGRALAGRLNNYRLQF